MRVLTASCPRGGAAGEALHRLLRAGPALGPYTRAEIAHTLPRAGESCPVPFSAASSGQDRRGRLARAARRLRSQMPMETRSQRHQRRGWRPALWRRCTQPARDGELAADRLLAGMRITAERHAPLAGATRLELTLLRNDTPFGVSATACRGDSWRRHAAAICSRICGQAPWPAHLLEHRPALGGGHRRDRAG